MRRVLLLLLAFVLACSASITFTDGGASRIDFGNAGGTDPNSGTFYAWVYSTSTSTTRRIFVKEAGTAAGYITFNTPGTFGRIRFSIDYATTDGDAQSLTPLIVQNQWTFVAVTYTAGAAPKLYVGTLTTDAAEVSSYNGTPSAPSGARVTDGGASFILGNQLGFANAWGGDIDIINWIPGTVLSAAEILAHQKNPQPHASSAIFVPLGRANGNGTQTDLSSGGFSGTPTSTALGIAGVPIGVGAMLARTF